MVWVMHRNNLFDLPTYQAGGMRTTDGEQVMGFETSSWIEISSIVG